MRQEVAKAFATLCTHYNLSSCLHTAKLCHLIHLCRFFVTKGKCKNYINCKLTHKVTREAIDIMRQYKIKIDYSDEGKTDPSACLNLFSDVLWVQIHQKAAHARGGIQGADGARRDIPKEQMKFGDRPHPYSEEGEQGAQNHQWHVPSSGQSRTQAKFEDIATFLIEKGGSSSWREFSAEFRLNPLWDHIRWAKTIIFPDLDVFSQAEGFFPMSFVYPLQGKPGQKPEKVAYFSFIIPILANFRFFMHLNYFY